MAEVIEMPKLSDTMEEGVIAAWHKEVGDEVSSGELMVEIETDKATMDLESFEDGVLLHKGGDEGDTIALGGLLAIVGEKGEDVSDLIENFKSGKSDTGNGSADESKDEEKEEQDSGKAEEKEEKSESNSSSKDEKKKEKSVSTDKDRPRGTQTEDSSGRIKASPLARSMAEEHDIDLSSVDGSGDNGRIIKKDIEAYLEKGGTRTQAGSASVGVEENYTEKKVSQMRKTIAKRLAESKFSAPHFYLTMEINMDRTWESRKQINEISDIKISFNDIVIKAVAAALKKHPGVNASWQGDTIRYNEHVHIGMAVAVDEGLLVPVIRHANAKSLSQIAEESKSYAQRARDKDLQPEDWEGNTFTISNLGMYGIEEFTAIINPPDACILAIGGIIEKAIVKNGEIVPGRTMKVTLSCDHRVVDGATGSEFLRTLKNLLEDPIRILV